MPSTCPKCHQVLEEDEICCAQVRYTWKCKQCHQRSTGFAVPYGKCFLCGGQLEVIDGNDLGDSMRFRAVREAVEFELNSLHFYKLACDRARTPEQRAVLERMVEAELDHLHILEEKYHVHLDREVVDLSAGGQARLAGWLFQGISVEGGVRELYEAALTMEKRTRDHFRRLAAELPEGMEKELCLELAGEEEEHVALLEGEMEQI